MKVGTISEKLEDYLLIICQLLQEKGRARVKEIAERNGVRMSSVSAALKRLASKDLITYSARDNVELTLTGRELSRRLINRRDLVGQFLHKILGVPLSQAHEDAGGMEHHVSLETLDRLAAFQGFLQNDVEMSSELLDIPQRFDRHYRQCLTSEARPSKVDDGGVCTLTAGGEIERTLADLEPGERAIVKKILAKGAIRQRLVDMGFLSNVEILMERRAPLGDPIEVKIKGFHISLRKEEAERILVNNIV